MVPPPFSKAVRRLLRRTAAGSSVAAARTAALRGHGLGRNTGYVKAVGQLVGDAQILGMSVRVLLMVFHIAFDSNNYAKKPPTSPLAARAGIVVCGSMSSTVAMCPRDTLP
jgi:hypothetical protein